MRARLALPLIASCLLSANVCQADTEAQISRLDQCIQRLPAKQKDGLSHLTALCPDLEQALEDAGVKDRLPPHWDDHLGRIGLRQIKGLLQRYQGEPVSTAPGPQSVTAIAAALRTQQPKSGWWQRFRDWLGQLLTPRSGQRPNIFQRLIEQLFNIRSQRARQVILYGSLALVLALIGVIVWRELKAAGVWGRARRVAARRASPTVPAGTEGIDLSALQRLPLAEQPALLLRLLVEKLRQHGLLAGERTLTHRELIVRAGLQTAQQRQSFAQVSMYAEMQLYGPRHRAQRQVQGDLERIVREGHELYQQLSGSGSPAP